MKIKELYNGPWGELLRYLCSGGVAFAADFSILYLLTSVCGLHYLLSQLCSYLVGLVITYLLSIFWVYRRRKYGKVAIEFSLFALVGVVGVASTSLLMWLLTDLCAVNYLISKIITTVIVTLQNFLLRKRVLF